MSTDPLGAERARQAGRSMYDQVLTTILTGIAVILPFVITLYILNVAYGFIASALNPFVKVLEAAGLIEGVRQSVVIQYLLDTNIIISEVQLVTDVIALLVLTALVVVLGVIGRIRWGERMIDAIDRLVVAIPGVGTVYKSFRRLTDAMIESEMENFQEVKLVEFPQDNAYTVGFKTANAPASIHEAAQREDMETLFLPLAPNPVMGGFLAHVPAENVSDVDMTVEEGVRSIITSGIATGADGRVEDRRARLVEVDAASVPTESDDAGGESADAGAVEGFEFVDEDEDSED